MKSKLIWAVSIITASAAYLFENNAGTLTVLACVVLLPLVGMLLALIPPKLEIDLTAPYTVEKGEMIRCNLRIKNCRRFPIQRLEFAVQCCNLHSAHKEQEHFVLCLLPRQSKQFCFSLASDYCGQMELAAHIEAYGDLFGILHRNDSRFVKKELLVMPTLFAQEIHISEQGMAMPDSDIYSPDKPGNDPGETFAIREYVPGDAIRQIHWKLSEKTGKTVVREFGLPVVNDLLILLDTAGAASEAETDALTEIFASLCRTLSDRATFYQVGWRDPASDALCLQSMEREEDYLPLLYDLLRLSPMMDGSVAQRFTEQTGHCTYSHVVIVSAQRPEGTQDLYNGNRITLILPRRLCQGAGMQPDGIYVFPFMPDTFAAELSALEM